MMITLWAAFYLGHLLSLYPDQWFFVPYLATSCCLIIAEIVSIVYGVFCLIDGERDASSYY